MPGLAIVRWCLDVSVVAGLEYEGFVRREASNGRGGICQQERLRSIWKKTGMDLSAKRSGNKSENATPKLSKNGKADLRYALYQAALIASCKNILF